MGTVVPWDWREQDFIPFRRTATLEHERGRAMPFEQAVEYALEDDEPSST